MVALRAVCVFCGSSAPADPRYRDAARALGALIARRGVDLVYGAGSVGLMGELADAALGHGGRVIGVIPAGLFAREVGHTGLTELHEVASMHERKQLMYDLSDAFVALPGGLGTLEELAEVATWSQLGLHSKPVALLDVDGFWEPLVSQLDRMTGVGLLKPASRDLIQRTRSAEEALRVLAAARPARPEKWISAEER
ncbi:MAG TPA: TIGR00730 family Rossman fold protein [Streptosporangiaceae bacterium]|nr:TIGR00730 family Rossman fold protein [Streptosporangiaceae bacterium]